MRLRLPLLLLVAGLAGCASVRGHLPWGHSAEPPPVPVRELAVVLPEQGTPPVVLQYRERNTLVVDLTAVAASGSVRLQPGADGTWPVRLALRVLPGRVGAVEVRGAQRAVLPISPEAGKPVTVALSPALHAPGTAELLLTWGPKDAF